jgi:hypothetical protein
MLHNLGHHEDRLQRAGRMPERTDCDFSLICHRFNPRSSIEKSEVESTAANRRETVPGLSES